MGESVQPWELDFGGTPTLTLWLPAHSPQKQARSSPGRRSLAGTLDSAVPTSSAMRLPDLSRVSLFVLLFASQCCLDFLFVM